MKNLLVIFANLLLLLNSCAQTTPMENHTITTSSSSTNMPMKRTETEWKQQLSPEQYYVLREKGTEPAFSGEFVFHKEKGVYRCAACGSELFTDDMKFPSHCGWPSFDREITGGKIIQTEDLSHGMQRIEITCAKCGGHLGHIFDDGPTTTGKRYCVNSLSLTFEPANAPTTTDKLLKSEQITLGGGCFWCIEAIFEALKGVEKVESGYSGGHKAQPTYREVCTGNTGHAEVVQLTYQPQEISLEEILEVFFTLHDPTSLNRQGADVGTQYRSAIFYHTPEQKAIAEKAIQTLNDNKVFDRPIVTEVTAFDKFYKAENYHQEYFAFHREEPYCKAVIQPKMDKLHKVFKDKLKSDIE